jgi:hypothetical protein
MELPKFVLRLVVFETSHFEFVFESLTIDVQVVAQGVEAVVTIA